jgi:GNAT superfamily N-acetyltransferase
VRLGSEAPCDVEAQRMMELADYDVRKGSPANTRCVYVGEEHVGFYVLHRNYINFLHIFQPYRRRGYGRVVVAMLCAAHPNLFLHSTPKARTFWQHCGFVVRNQDGDEQGRACVEMAWPKVKTQRQC